MSAWALRIVRNEDRKETLWQEMQDGRTGGDLPLTAAIEPTLVDAFRLTPNRGGRWAARIGDEWLAEPLCARDVVARHYTPTEVTEAVTRLEEQPDPGRPWKLNDIRESLRLVRKELIEVIHPRAGTGRQLAATTALHPGEGDRITEDRQRNAATAREWREKIEAQIKNAAGGMQMPRASRIETGTAGRLRQPTKHDRDSAERAKARLRAQAERLRSEGFEKRDHR